MAARHSVRRDYLPPAVVLAAFSIQFNQKDTTLRGNHLTKETVSNCPSSAEQRAIQEASNTGPFALSLASLDKFNTSISRSCFSTRLSGPSTKRLGRCKRQYWRRRLGVSLQLKVPRSAERSAMHLFSPSWTLRTPLFISVTSPAAHQQSTKKRPSYTAALWV